MQNWGKNREKREKRQNSIKNASRRATFRSNARFWAVLGSRPGSRNRSHGASDVEKKRKPGIRLFRGRPLGAPVPFRTPFSMNFGSPETLPDHFWKFFFILPSNSESSRLLFLALSPSRFLSFPQFLPQWFSRVTFLDGFPKPFSTIAFPNGSGSNNRCKQAGMSSRMRINLM